MSNAQALQRRTEALQYIERAISPELKAQHAADRILVMKDQYGLALTWPQFLSYLEMLREKNCSVHDRDFHALPTRTKTPDGKWVDAVEFVASIHFFRKNGSADKRYRGRVGPEYAHIVGKDEFGNPIIDWRPEYLLPGNPIGIRCGIKVDGLDGIEWAYIRFNEFAKDTKTWKEMPVHMSGKVAEAHAWRAALPNAIQGVYVEEEVELERNAVSYSVSDTWDDEQPQAPALSGRLPALSAPTEQPVQAEESDETEEPATKSPEDAQREVLVNIIKQGIVTHTAFTTGRPIWKDVRAVCSMIENSGPMTDGKPDFPNWTNEQLEQLADKYSEFNDQNPYKRPEGWEEDAEPATSDETETESAEVTDVDAEVVNPL